MIQKRTYAFLLGAVLTSLPGSIELLKEKPICVQDSQRHAPQQERLVRVAAEPVRLMRVQEGERPVDDQNYSPCPSTGYGAFVKVITFVAGCFWICFFSLAASDIQSARRQRRRHRRSSRAR